MKTEALSTQCTRLKTTFERALADTGLAAWGHYYIALADYRIADYLLAAGEENKGAASEHLKDAVDHLQKATEIDPQAAEAYSLLSSAYGRQIGLKPIKGMVLGRKAQKALKKSDAARTRQSARRAVHGYPRL